MALGRSKVQQRFENPREILGDRLKEGSIYRLLADHGDRSSPTTTSPISTATRRGAARRSRPG